jgi:hypothetical protein
LLKRQQKAAYFAKSDQKAVRTPSALSNTDSATTYKSSRANSLESTFNIKETEIEASAPKSALVTITVNASENFKSEANDMPNASNDTESVHREDDGIPDDDGLLKPANNTTNDTNPSNSCLGHRQRNHTFSSFHHIKNSLSGSTITVNEDHEVPPVPKFLHSPSSLSSLKQDSVNNHPRKPSLGVLLPFPSPPASGNPTSSGTNNIKGIESPSSSANAVMSRRTSISRIFNVGRSKKTRSNSKTNGTNAQPSLTLSTFRKNSIAESIEETPIVLQQQYSATGKNVPVASPASSTNRFPHFHKPTSMNASNASNNVEFKNPFSDSSGSSTASLQAMTDGVGTPLPLPCKVRKSSWSTIGSSNPGSPRTPTSASTIYPHPIMIQSSNSRKSSAVLEPIVPAAGGGGPPATEHVSFFKNTFSKKSKVW